MTVRRGRRHKQLMDVLEEEREYEKLKYEALDLTCEELTMEEATDLL